MKSVRVLVAIGVGAAMLSVSAPAFAGQTEPGTPGDKNCKGQTTAWVAQAGETGFFTANGIGNVAKANDAGVKDVKFLIGLYCAGIPI